MGGTGREVQSMPPDICPRTFEFAKNVLLLCDRLIRRGGVCSLIGWQLAKAGGSTGANLEEAQAGQSKRDFIARASIARKESREALYWLKLAEVVPSPPEPGASRLRQEANELVSILTAIVMKAESSASRG
jgi:four helix bundle protein